jgi:endonuclease III
VNSFKQIFSSADVGGLLGLFMGCSILSVIEIFYIVGSYLSDRKTEQKTKDTSTELEEVKVVCKTLLKLNVQQLRLNMEQSRLNNEQNKKVENLSRRLMDMEKTFIVVEDYETC